MFKCSLFFITAFAVTRLAAQNQPLPELADARVSIPYSELKSLWQAAQPPPTPNKGKPPVTVALLSSRYQVTWQAESAEVVAEFETESFTDEWNVLPLLGSEAQIASVEPADAQIILRDDRYALVTHAPGKAKTKIRFSVKLTGSDDAPLLHCAIAPAFINVLTVAGAPADRSIRVPGATPISTENGLSTFRLPAVDQLNIEMATEKRLAPPIASQWKLESQAFLQTREGKLLYHARLVARTDAGSGLTLLLALPAGANILDLKSEDLANWRAQTVEDRSRQVQIQWTTRDVLSRQIILEYELPQPAIPGEWKLTAPQIVGGEATNALFAISGEDGIELTPATAVPSPERLPRWLLEQANSRSFAVVGTDGSLQSRWLPMLATTPATIERAKATMRLVADGSLLNEMVYSIRTELPLAWPLRLPPGSELLSCSIDGRPADPIDRGDGLIELPIRVSDRNAPVEVRLSYTARKPAFQLVSGQVKVELPQTALLIHLIEWELRIPAAYEVAALEGNVETLAGSGSTENGARLVRLRKELCKAEMPEAEIFYQKPDLQN